MVEHFANHYITTLTARIVEADTSMTVASVTGDPDVPYRGIIARKNAFPEEIVIVTNVVGTTLTITRAAEAVAGVQTAWKHPVGATFTAILTAAQMDAAPAVVTAEVADARGWDTTLGGRISLIEDYSYHVARKGADPTGVADSTTAISDAIDDAETNRVIDLGRGTYNVSALVLTKAVRLIGQGAKLVSPDGAGQVLTATGIAGIRLEGVALEGKQTGVATAVARFIGCTDLRLDGVDVSMGRSIGLMLEGTTARLRGVVAHENGGADGVVGAGIYVKDDAGTPSRVYVTDCEGYSNGLGVGLDGTGLHVAETSEVIVSGFTGYGNTRYGCKDQSSGGGLYSNVHVYSNVTGFSTPTGVDISINGLYTHDNTVYGLWLDTGCRYIEVLNLNAVANLSGVRIEATASDIEITNARLRNSTGRNLDAASGASGVVLVNVDSWNPGVASTGSNAQAGFYLVATNNVTLIGCSARDTRVAGTGAQHYGFNMSTATNVRMSGCRADPAETRFGSVNPPTSYADRNSGTASIATGATIPHLLAAAPTKFGVMSTTSAGAFCSADATNLTVTLADGGTQVVKWWAEV